MIAGEYLLSDTDIHANIGRATTILTVINTGDRPIQVGSHYHFFEVNKALAFDRARAFGMRLNIPSGNAVRFEAGERKTVTLVAYGGTRTVRGFHQLVDGTIQTQDAEAASQRAYDQGFNAAINPQQGDTP